MSFKDDLDCFCLNATEELGATDPVAEAIIDVALLLSGNRPVSEFAIKQRNEAIGELLVAAIEQAIEDFIESHNAATEGEPTLTQMHAEMNRDMDKDRDGK